MDGVNISPDGSPRDEFGGQEDNEETNYDNEYDGYQEPGEEGEYDENMTNDREGETDEDIAQQLELKVPVMPDSFYSNVDSFLTKPPPQFSAFAKGGKGKPSSNKKSISDIGVVLPQLGPTPSVNKKKHSSSSKIKSRIAEANDFENRFDPVLVNEAFAYVDQIQREAIVDEEEAGFQMANAAPMKTSSAPQLSQVSAERSGKATQANPYQGGLAKPKKQGKTKKQKEGSSSSGVVRRLRSQTNVEPDAAFSNLSGTEYSGNKSRDLDVASMVENFEKGILLNKLRNELAASKQSIAESESFMIQMSKEYSRRR
jgi:hypothetical protein